MDPRISFITLAVADLEASRAFYVDRLGWTEALHVEGDVCMIKTGDRLVFSLWQREHFEAEVGAIAGGPGVPPFTLSHNVVSEAEVDAILAEARAAGADPVHAAQQREWGGYTGYLDDGTPTGFKHGYSGYFADPDGYRWEIAYNPQDIGQSVLPE